MPACREHPFDRTVAVQGIHGITETTGIDGSIQTQGRRCPGISDRIGNLELPEEITSRIESHQPTIRPADIDRPVIPDGRRGVGARQVGDLPVLDSSGCITVKYGSIRTEIDRSVSRDGRCMVYRTANNCRPEDGTEYLIGNRYLARPGGLFSAGVPDSNGSGIR